MRFAALVLSAACVATLAGCSRASAPKASGEVAWDQTSSSPLSPTGRTIPSGSGNPNLGFDRNDYPGDETMAAMRSQFGFTGYWLNNPPGADSNSWKGKRALLRAQGWGFLVLANGRLDAEILKAQKKGTSAAELGRKDAAQAVAAAKAEAFPANTILFLDQEEGGRLLDEQAAYLLAWTESVSTSGFKAGVYASAQPVSDAPGTTITTVRDIRTRVTAQHLHTVAIFAAQDQCPPAPGCTTAAKPISSVNEPDVIAWQYAQSPRRPEITQSCGKTYSSDGNCYAPGFPGVFLDMNIATSSDPSHGR
ncbi:glycoside hydrolase domain-containing protein [Granulicella cerasi]|uniref:Glycoside hydrolase domain-containing protein n=1 Tax=Granulicella cerasi TaxID=741063 RepID=A0ABW1Z7S6_9BACT|nr:glycoside hydrolase domain-containing protein [Granulicella cerasi]